VALSPKAFEVLVLLVQRRGHLVGKEELMSSLWPDSFVEEANLTHQVWTLRKALGESKDGQQYIETVPKQGYRFIAQVRECEEPSNHPVTEQAETGSHENNEPASLNARSEKEGTGNRPRLTLLVVPLLGISLVAAAFYVWTARRPQQTNPHPSIRSIAVLPFKPLGAEGSDEALELGMADALITRLGRLRQIVVRPTNAVLKYHHPDQDPLAAGREQKVDAFLDGRIQQAGERIRVTAQMVRVSDGTTLWADQFDDHFTSIFEVEDAISEKMAQALVLKLTAEERKLLAKRYTDNIEAYQAYLQGRFHTLSFTKDGVPKGIEYFNRAIGIDPNYALAWAGLAEAYFISADWYLAPQAVMPKAREAAKKALEIDDALAEAHTSLAEVEFIYDWNWPEAEQEFKRAIQLNPGYASAHALYGEYLAATGRFDQSIVELKQARELDPLSPDILTLQGEPFYFARQYDQAVEQFSQAVALNPDIWLAHLYLGWAYEQQGRMPEAVAEFEKARQLNDLPEIEAGLGYAYAVTGRRAEARKVLKKLQEQASKRYVSPWNQAIIYSGLGDKEAAFVALDKACAERSEWLVWLKVEPAFAVLHAELRFADLLRCVGIAS